MIFRVIKYIGDLLIKFRRKQTTIEILEGLDKQIKDYENFKQKSQTNERKYVGALIFYSIILYIVGAVFHYLYLMPKNFIDRTKSLLPFLITPFILYFTRKFLKWFYIKRSLHYDTKLKELKAEKTKLLEEVKEKETYKKAREILERFSEEEPKELNESTKLSQSQLQKQEQSHLNKNSTINQPKTPINTFDRNQSLLKSNINEQNQSIYVNGRQNLLNNNTPFKSIDTPNTLGNRLPRNYVPRPFIPQQRSSVDKIIDFFIGDGPNNRYALICQNCCTHNGMALKEEFEFVAFRCAYCFYFNPSRKKKLSVPDLKRLNDAPASLEPAATTTNTLTNGIEETEENIEKEITLNENDSEVNNESDKNDNEEPNDQSVDEKKNQ